MRLSKQIVKLQVEVQEPQKTAREGNGNQCNTRSQGKNQINGEGCDHKGIKCFQCEGWDIELMSA